MILLGLIGGCAHRAVNTLPTPGIADDYDFTIRVGGLERCYTVHVPQSYDGITKVPVVIMLHGAGGKSWAAAYETGWGAKADQSGFLAVFPNAMPPDPDRRSNFIWNPQLWNDGSDRFYHEQKPVDDVGFLTAMIDELQIKFRVDAERIFFTGFSNGASMAFRMGAELSNRVAAIAPVAGASWVDPLALKRPIPVLYITGTDDPLNPIEGGVPKLATGGSDKIRSKPKPSVRDSILKWAKAMGCPETPQSKLVKNGVHTEIYGPCNEGTEIVYIAVNGLGHTWAGGKSLLPGFIVGEQSDKINATDVIWDFFEKHSRSKSLTSGEGASGLEARHD